MIWDSSSFPCFTVVKSFRSWCAFLLLFFLRFPLISLHFSPTQLSLPFSCNSGCCCSQRTRPKLTCISVVWWGDTDQPRTRPKLTCISVVWWGDTDQPWTRPKLTCISVAWWGDTDQPRTRPKLTCNSEAWWDDTDQQRTRPKLTCISVVWWGDSYQQSATRQHAENVMIHSSWSPCTTPPAGDPGLFPVASAHSNTKWTVFTVHCLPCIPYTTYSPWSQWEHCSITQNRRNKVCHFFSLIIVYKHNVKRHTATQT